MAKGTFLDYVVNNDPNKYPSDGLHTDGNYYEKVANVTINGVNVKDNLNLESDILSSSLRISNLSYNFYCGSAVVFDGDIHILGGQFSSTYTSHYFFNGTKWTFIASLPYDFYYGAAVVLNGEIHILGGRNSSVQTKHYKWDGSSWTEVSTLPYAFYAGGAVVLNGEIHILGSGYDSLYYKYHYRRKKSTFKVKNRQYFGIYGST